MPNLRLFTAIYIPETPFANEVLQPKKAKKYKLELLEGRRIADTLYHFIYKKDGKQIHSYYFIGDVDTEWERYLFIENNTLYDDYVSQFSRYGERRGVAVEHDKKY